MLKDLEAKVYVAASILNLIYDQTIYVRHWTNFNEMYNKFWIVAPMKIGPFLALLCAKNKRIIYTHAQRF
jgi:hypothetical protein